jgi:hypothetical protein
MWHLGGCMDAVGTWGWFSGSVLLECYSFSCLGFDFAPGCCCWFKPGWRVLNRWLSECIFGQCPTQGALSVILPTFRPCPGFRDTFRHGACSLHPGELTSAVLKWCYSLMCVCRSVVCVPVYKCGRIYWKAGKYFALCQVLSKFVMYSRHVALLTVCVSLSLCSLLRPGSLVCPAWCWHGHGYQESLQICPSLTVSCPIYVTQHSELLWQGWRNSGFLNF